MTMRGAVLTFNPDCNSGLISGFDGKRYTFSRIDWHCPPPIVPGKQVHFTIEDGLNARFITDSGLPYDSLKHNAAPKEKFVTALLALFLGAIGAHYFYLNRFKTATLYLCLSFSIIGLIIVFPLIFIDFIRFIWMSDDVFNARYNH